MSDKQGPSPAKATGSVPVPDIARRGVRGFISDVRSEMKKVIWPTRIETLRLTGIVLAVCALAVSILFTLGWAFSQGLDALLRLRG